MSHRTTRCFVHELPAEVLGMIMDNVTLCRDLKSLTEVCKRLRAAALPRFWCSVCIKPRRASKSRHMLHNLPSFCPSQLSLSFTKDIEFQATFESDSVDRCPHFQPETCKDSSWESDGRESDTESLDDDQNIFYQPWWFDQLTDTAETILDMFKDNQLRSFSWDMGTCIPEGILGPNGIINSRQACLQSLSLTTDWQCYRDNPLRRKYPCRQRSMINLNGLRKLKRLRWRAPHAEDIYTLSLAICANREHLGALELDFIDWKQSINMGLRNTEMIGSDCPLFSDLLDLAPACPTPLFPNLKDLSLSQCFIGPGLAIAVDFDALRSLKLRGCPGWCGFMEKITSLQITPKIKVFELLVTRDNIISSAQRDQNATKFLKSFDHLEELYLLFGHPWFPNTDFWDAVAGHEDTLRRCILDGLWDHVPSYRRREVPHLTETGVCLPVNPLISLDLEYVGLLNDPDCMRAILLPFSFKTCLKVIHVRQSYLLPWREQVWDWKENTMSGRRSLKEGPSNPGDQLRKVRLSHRCFENTPVRLQEEFCRFVEWAFSLQGIRSLRTIAIGDYSPAFDQLESQLFIQRGAGEEFVILTRGSMQWDEEFQEHQEFLQSCPKTRLF